jgi:hypothetical protein
MALEDNDAFDAGGWFEWRLWYVLIEDAVMSLKDNNAFDTSRRFRMEAVLWRL